MPEEFTEEHKKHYQYAGNSNLVLPSDRSKQTRRNERGKEMESLWGKITTNQMGSGIQRHVPSKPLKHLEQEISKLERKQQKQQGLRTGYRDILAATEDSEGTYRPRSRETRVVWDMMLALCGRFIGDQTPEVLVSAADEVLGVLKDEEKKDVEKRKQVEGVFGSQVGEADFSRFLQLSRQITDFGEIEEQEDAVVEVDEAGIAVVFGGSDAEDDAAGAVDEHSGFVNDGGSSDSDSEESVDEPVRPDTDLIDDEENVRLVVGGNGSQQQQQQRQQQQQEQGAILQPREIDAFWLQRQVARHFADPETLQEKTSAADRLLSDANLGVGELENELAELFDYEHFDLVQLLVTNCDVIVWSMRMARAEAEGIEQRRAVEAQIRAAGKAWILDADVSVSTEKAKAVVESQMGNETVSSSDVYSPQSNVDLESLAFAEGGRLMTNDKWVAPAGANKTLMPGYEEIRVPAPPPLSAQDAKEPLVPIARLPLWAQQAFPNVTELNAVQSRVYPAAFETDSNMLICAPTGAGKTNCAALAMLRTIGRFMDAATGRVDLAAFKMVYVAPMKALVTEMAGAFAKRLEPLGLRVSELTGDSQLTKQQISETQLLVTTPEKWDVVTRKGDDRSYTRLVRLVIIDEIHLLHDDRGPVLEALAVRLKQSVNVRLVGLSATLPNYEDVATFLRVPREAVFYFDARYRPCPLQMEFIGLTDAKHVRRLERMDAVCYEKARREAARGGQVLVFVHSRKETVRTAQRLRDMAVEAAQVDAFVRAGSASSEVLREEAGATGDAALADLLPFGLAVHHAGMARADRALAEDLFADGHVRVLVSTATLAWGVNLPAHTVIIKGTQVYSPARGSWTELSPQDVLQMLGRAGRPQYDTYGEGIIITAHSELRYYLSLMSQQLPIESQLVARLPDALNAEVALGNVRSRGDAAGWLAHTYLFVRMLRSPTVYGVTREMVEEDAALALRRSDLAHAAAVELERCGMVRYDRRGGRLQSTELGRVASHYYITYRSMATYQQHLRASAGDIDILAVFSRSDEFHLLPVRAEERIELARLSERVPIPIRDSAEGSMAKIAVLLQAHVARLKLPGFALAADAVYVTQSAGRIFRALFELSRARGWARAARCALGWCKQVERRMWLAMSPLRQFGRECPQDLLRAVERKPLPWTRYLDLSEAELGELVNSHKAGRLLYRLVHLVPRLEVRAHVQPLTRSLLRFELRITPDFVWNDAVHGAAEQFWITVEDADGERLLHAEMLVVKRAYAGKEHLVEFTCALGEPMPPQYFVAVDSDRWIGSETRLPVSFRNLHLPDRAMPPTELLDMQPLSVSELREPEFEALYDGCFNAVQTQCFNALYRTDDSVFLGAAPGCGKTRAAELALLRFFRQEAQRAQDEGDAYVRRRVVYLAPFSTLVQQRARDWQERFGHLQGGKTVAVLTGDAASDLRRCAAAHIVLSTPMHWDALSRRWRQRQRQPVRDIGLVIVDEMHWVGGAGLGATADDLMLAVNSDGSSVGADVAGDHLAATLEIVVSRVRFMAAQLERPIRIVALSVPLANARDVAAWVGVPVQNVFNFHPAVRPVPLEIRILTSGVAHFASRTSAWVTPVYRTVTEMESGPSLVFVASRRMCRAVASDLVDLAAADEMPNYFLEADSRQVDSAVLQQSVSDAVLRDLLGFGIGYYHEALSLKDRKTVLELFTGDLIRVLVASRETCWALDSVHARTVVIMGAEKYSGREHRYSDYAVPEILQMMGRAGRPPLVDYSQATCVLMCMTNKREFYKKFLYEPLPVESRLDGQLHDAMNSEVVAKTIENKQDAVDYLTWTLMYRRLVQNPNYYGLQGTTHEHLSDYLSELIESTINDLVAAKCVSMENEMDATPTNLGMIAAFYQIRYLTVEMFALSLSAKTKLRGVLDILTAADEFEALPIRHREAAVLERIASRLPVPLPSTDGDGDGEGRWNSPRVRTHLLLQAHFSRLSLPADLSADQAWVLSRVLPLLQALVDVASSMGWLAPALAAMELSQMAVQAVWEGKDPLVKQIPHLSDPERLQVCAKMRVDSVFDVMDMEDEDRAKMLQGLVPRQVAEVAQFVNRYPNIEVDYAVRDPGEIVAGGAVTVEISLDREWDDDEEEEAAVVGPVVAPFYPYARTEGWWVVVGDTATQTLLTVKKVNVGRRMETAVEFAAPENAGHVRLKMFLMCDSYLGCDHEFDLEFDVQEDDDDDDDDDDEDDEDDEGDKMDED